MPTYAGARRPREHGAEMRRALLMALSCIRQTGPVLVDAAVANGVLASARRGSTPLQGTVPRVQKLRVQRSDSTPSNTKQTSKSLEAGPKR